MLATYIWQEELTPYMYIIDECLPIPIVAVRLSEGALVSPVLYIASSTAILWPTDSDHVT